MAKKKGAGGQNARESRDTSDGAEKLCEAVAQAGEWAASALVAAEELGIKTKPLEQFWLAPGQREVLRQVPGTSRTIKNKLTNENVSFTVAEVASMTMALAEDLLDSEPQKQAAQLFVARHLMERLQDGIVAMSERKQPKPKRPKAQKAPEMIYQFKITLVGSKPPIWRRIQVEDCTLDELHEYVQAAMGWTNSHLHQFEIDGERYGNPEFLDDGYGDFDCIDSTRTRISEVLPKRTRGFRFRYEYDFGDGWEHDVLLEDSFPPKPNTEYPICIKGKRACPPEDIGGIWGYAELLEALADPKHERHNEFMEWADSFDPEGFDAVETTKTMQGELPEFGN
jgi:hypothetical protein